MFEIVPAAEPAGRGPALGFLGGVCDPAGAAPGADQDRRPALASRPGRQRAAVDRLAVPHAIHDFEVVLEGAEAVVVIVAEQLEIVACRAAADPEDQAVVRQHLQRIKGGPAPAQRIADPDTGEPPGFGLAGEIGDAIHQPGVGARRSADPDHRTDAHTYFPSWFPPE